MITEREKYLMRTAIECAEQNGGLDAWLEEAVTDSGHTMEELISHSADEHASKNPVNYDNKIKVLWHDLEEGDEIKVGDRCYGRDRKWFDIKQEHITFINIIEPASYPHQRKFSIPFKV